MDENLLELLESKATPERRKEAEEQGWIPPERFKGEAKDFRDADEYLERAETITPIVNQKNRELREQLRQEKLARQNLEDRFKAQGTAIKVLQEAHEEQLAASVAQAREEILAELAVASSEQDHTKIAELTGQLVELKDVEKGAKKGEEKEDLTPPAGAPEPTPAYKAWLAKPENAWFGVDRRRTAYAVAVGNDLAADLHARGETIDQTDFLERVNAEVERSYPKTSGEGTPSKVGSGNHGTPKGNGGGGKTFRDLPADAKTACHQFSAQLVGANKKYKTLADWEVAYTKKHYAEEGR